MRAVMARCWVCGKPTGVKTETRPSCGRVAAVVEVYVAHEVRLRECDASGTVVPRDVVLTEAAK